MLGFVTLHMMFNILGPTAQVPTSMCLNKTTHEEQMENTLKTPLGTLLGILLGTFGRKAPRAKKSSSSIASHTPSPPKTKGKQ
jgi:hypothetical protein